MCTIFYETGYMQWKSITVTTKNYTESIIYNKKNQPKEIKIHGYKIILVGVPRWLQIIISVMGLYTYQNFEYNSNQHE